MCLHFFQYVLYSKLIMISKFRKTKVKINQSFLNFLMANINGLKQYDIYIDKTIFQEIWDECYLNGNIRIKQPKTVATKDNAYGIYDFIYKDKDNIAEIHVVIGNKGILAGEKQYKVLKVHSKFVKIDTMLKDSLFTPKILIERERQQEQIATK